MKTNMAFAETLTSGLRQTPVGVARGDAKLWKEEKANNSGFPQIVLKVLSVSHIFVPTVYQ